MVVFRFFRQTMSLQMPVTEDTPPDMLSGAMDLNVILPNGSVIKMSVERRSVSSVELNIIHYTYLSNRVLLCARDQYRIWKIRNNRRSISPSSVRSKFSGSQHLDFALLTPPSSQGIHFIL